MMGPMISDNIINSNIEDAIVATELPEPQDMTETLRRAFIVDMAQGIDDNRTIAWRYGMTLEAMFAFIQRPGVLRMIKEARAIWNSSAGITDRAKAYYSLVALEASTRLDRQLHNDKTPLKEVMEGIKLAASIGGLTTTVGKDNPQNGGVSIAPFSINISFPPGLHAAAQHIVVTGAASPSPNLLPIDVDVDDPE